MKSDQDPDEVTDGDIRQYIALKTTKPAMDELYGEGKWGKDQVADYIRLRRKAKVEAKGKRASAKRQGIPLPPANAITFEQRYREYELAYEGLTPNDKTSLKTMVTLEIQIEQAQQDMLAQENIIHRAKIAESITTMSREHRQLQDSMGMARARRKQETNAQDEINRLRDGARDFVERLGTQIRCTHCTSKFEMGLVLFHFRDDVPWHFEFTCPKCDQISRLEGVVIDTNRPAIMAEAEVPF